MADPEGFPLKPPLTRIHTWLIFKLNSVTSTFFLDHCSLLHSTAFYDERNLGGAYSLVPRPSARNGLMNKVQILGPKNNLPYSSKFSWHKIFVKCSISQKLLIFVVKISWLLQNFVSPHPFTSVHIPCAHFDTSSCTYGLVPLESASVDFHSWTWSS